MLALNYVALEAAQHIKRRRAAHAVRHLSESQHSDLPSSAWHGSNTIDRMLANASKHFAQVRFGV